MIVSALRIEPTHVTFHRPAGTLRARSFGSQGGGLYIVGTATLTNTNVYENEATGSVCSLFLTFCIARTFLPSPRWNADRCYVHCLAGCELSRKSNPCVTFHRPTELTLELTDCCVRVLLLRHRSV